MIKLTILLAVGIALVASVPSERAYRVTGGANAKPGDIPFHVVYLVDSRITCSGVIISPTIAMTAAHCVPKKYKSSSVYAGATQLISNPGGVRKHIVRTYIHEDYNGGNQNDIALLFLNVSSPFVFDNLIQPAVLPSEYEDYQQTTTTAVVASWGEDRHLKSTIVRLIPRQNCIDLIGDIGTNVICAGSENKKQDVCGGNSGGPLFIGKKVFGLESGWPCALASRPGAFTDIGRLRTWIHRHTSV